jgi:hypothetical protein
VEELAEDSKLVKAISGSFFCQGFRLLKRLTCLSLSVEGVWSFGGGDRIIACSLRENL